MHRLLLLISFVCTVSYAQNSCRFSHPSKGVIDLSSTGRSIGSARFQDVTLSAASPYMYSFNPCYSFSEQNCQNVAACRLTKDRQNSHPLGLQAVSSWSTDETGNAVLTYSQGAETLAVTMMCSPGSPDTLEIIGEGPVNRFRMILRSPCACWNGCIGPQTTPTTTITTPATTTHPFAYWDACFYYDSQRGKIDLSSIGRSNNIAAFRDIHDAQRTNYRWSYNPCFSFSEDNCQDVAACQIDKQMGTSYPIAYQTRTNWINMHSNGSNARPTIIYESSGLRQSRLQVELVCDHDVSGHELKVIGEIVPGNYLMQLTSQCACWNGCLETTFHWKTWMTIASGAAVLACCMISLFTCLLCSKPSRQRRGLVINEKSPIYQHSFN